MQTTRRSSSPNGRLRNDRRRPPSARAQADADLTARAQAIHARSRGTYGAPRVHAELSDAGVSVSRKRVARVMREAGIAGVSRRRGPRTTRRDSQARPAPDRVERRFEADAPNRLWVADITYIPTLAGFLYLAIVLDVFSRRVVGWAMAAHLRTTLVLEALEMAVVRNAGRSRSSITRTKAASTRRWPSAPGAGSGALRRRWARWAIASTTRWPRASSPRWSASCSTARRWRRTPRRGRPCSSSLKGGTTPAGAIPRWATCRRWSSNVSVRQPLSTLTSRWRLSRRPRVRWSPDRRRRLPSAAVFFWKHPEGMMANRHTARLRFRRRDSRGEPVDEKMPGDLQIRRVSRRPAGSGSGHCTTGSRDVRTGRCGTARPVDARSASCLIWMSARRAPTGRWKSRGRPLSIMPATRAARFPQFHNASSLLTLHGTVKSRTCHDVNPKALTRPRNRGNLIRDIPPMRGRPNRARYMSLISIVRASRVAPRIQNV